ncbi:NIF3-like protein 1 [Caligus rogercresseyi]|uniref:NIF3-like protein 1 n=1 Tax=Caligus rogercresseyi TaxID=217165 RepID=A0A7T8JWI2_CALRO|nr:NIF3-like protein 1 [Caligus rogercresseyi]
MWTAFKKFVNEFWNPKLPVPIFPEGKVTKLSLTDLSPDSISTLHTLMSSSVDAVESTPSSIQFSFEDKRLGRCNKQTPRIRSQSLNKASFDTLTSHIGAGRVSQLKAKLPLKQVVEKTKSHLGLEHVRLALGNGKTKGTFF